MTLESMAYHNMHVTSPGEKLEQALERVYGLVRHSISSPSSAWEFEH